MGIPECEDHDIDDLLRLIEFDLPADDNLKRDWERAAHLMLDDKHQTAERILVDLVDDCPTPAIWNTLVIVYINLRREESINLAIHKAKEIQESNLVTMTLWGILWSMSELPGTQIRLFQKAIDIYPDEPLPRKYLLSALLERKEFESAYEQLIRLTELTPTDDWVWSTIGHVIIQLDNHESSERSLCDLLTKNKHNPTLWYALGNIMVRESRWADAEKALRRALQLDPDFSQARFYMGIVHRTLHRNKAAIKAFRRAVALDPSLSAAWMNLGIALMQEGNEQEAQVAFDNAYEASPEEFDSGLDTILTFARSKGVI